MITDIHDPPITRHATVVALANQKGGVGKSTTTINLGAGLALQGERVLLVDIDTQANTTSGLGIDRERLSRTIYHVLVEDTTIDNVIEPTSLRGLFVVPASIELAGAEIELVSLLARETRLRNALDKVRADFDFILVDCPPSLGLLSINGLTTADEVLIPIQCEYYALEGVGLLMRNIGLVRQQLNPELDVEGMLLTMFDGRTTLSSDVVRQVHEHFGETAYRTVVPRTVRLSEAPSYGEPIEAFDPMSHGAIAYREVAREFRRRHGQA